MLSRFLSYSVFVIIPVWVGMVPVTAAIAQTLPTSVTSIQQVRDVSRNDPYYQALRSLIEQYGLNFTYADGTFRGNQALTRAEFMVYLHQTLENLEFSPPATPNSFSTSIYHSRDIQPTDFYYSALQELVENYGLSLDLIQGEFRPKRAITKGEAIRYFNQFFGYEGSTNNIISLRRGEFVIELYQALIQLDRNTELRELNAPN